jgi:hypothetical protein
LQGDFRQQESWVMPILNLDPHSLLAAKLLWLMTLLPWEKIKELMCALKVMNLWFVVMALETSHLCLMIFFILRPL